MPLYVEQFTATEPKRFELGGNFFLLQSVPGGVVDVTFWKDGRRLEESLEDVVAGWHAAPPTGFDSFDITSSLSQQVEFHVARGRVGSNVFSGQVNVEEFTEHGSHVLDGKPVSNVSLQILAANADRKFLSIQNQHATANLYVRCDGGVAVANANCQKIEPGETWEPKVAPVGAVVAIMDAATAGDTVHAIEA